MPAIYIFVSDVSDAGKVFRYLHTYCIISDGDKVYRMRACIDDILLDQQRDVFDVFWAGCTVFCLFEARVLGSGQVTYPLEILGQLWKCPLNQTGINQIKPVHIRTKQWDNVLTQHLYAHALYSGTMYVHHTCIHTHCTVGQCTYTKLVHTRTVQWDNVRTPYLYTHALYSRTMY
jgi:hypothetical protein